MLTMDFLVSMFLCIFKVQWISSFIALYAYKTLCRFWKKGVYAFRIDVNRDKKNVQNFVSTGHSLIASQSIRSLCKYVILFGLPISCHVNVTVK